MDFRAIREAAAGGAYVRRSGWVDRVWSRRDGLWWQTSFDQVDRVFGAPFIVRADDVTPFDYLATDWTLEPVPELQKGRWEGAPVSVEVEVRHALGAATRFGHRAFLGNKVYLTRKTWSEHEELRFAEGWHDDVRKWKIYKSKYKGYTHASVYVPGLSSPRVPETSEDTFVEIREYDLNGVLGFMTSTSSGTSTVGTIPEDLEAWPDFTGWLWGPGENHVIYDGSFPHRTKIKSSTLLVVEQHTHRVHARSVVVPQYVNWRDLKAEHDLYQIYRAEELSDLFSDDILLDCALAALGNYGGEELTETLGGIVRDSHAGYERWTVRVGLYRLVAKVPPFESGRYRFVWGVRSPDGLIERFEEEVVPEWQATVCRTAERAFTPSAQIGDFRVVDAAAFWIE